MPGLTSAKTLGCSIWLRHRRRRGAIAVQPQMVSAQSLVELDPQFAMLTLLGPGVPVSALCGWHLHDISLLLIVRMGCECPAAQGASFSGSAKGSSSRSGRRHVSQVCHVAVRQPDQERRHLVLSPAADTALADPLATGDTNACRTFFSESRPLSVVRLVSVASAPTSSCRCPSSSPLLLSVPLHQVV